MSKDQLTIVQEECTRLLLENRALKAQLGLAPALSQVRDFHKKFGVQILDKPTIPDRPHQELRKSLIYEECNEFFQAWTDQNLVEIADGLADLIYVCLGTALAYGIPLDQIFNEVHRTNMLKTKLSPRDDGKIMKPEGWQPPRIAEILGVGGHHG